MCYNHACNREAMTDTFTKKKRSWIMSRIRSGGNKATEIKLLGIFRKCGIVGWRRKYPLVGKPDFVFVRGRVAVFIDGCFWHCCPVHGTMPKSNRAHWIPKLERNYDRDREVGTQLRAMGWKVIRIWECELKNEKIISRKLSRLRNFLPESSAL